MKKFTLIPLLGIILMMLSVTAAPTQQHGTPPPGKKAGYDICSWLGGDGALVPSPPVQPEKKDVRIHAKTT